MNYLSYKMYTIHSSFCFLSMEIKIHLVPLLRLLGNKAQHSQMGYI